MKVTTIGQVAIATFTDDERDGFTHKKYEVENCLIYAGLVQTLPEKTARKFAQVHPAYQLYYENALMPLWQGRGVFRSGTESAMHAVLSCLPKGAVYMVAWKAINHEK